jgi:hypothetical protein
MRPTNYIISVWYWNKKCSTEHQLPVGMMVNVLDSFKVYLAYEPDHPCFCVFLTLETLVVSFDSIKLGSDSICVVIRMSSEKFGRVKVPKFDFENFSSLGYPPGIRKKIFVFDL